jgi:ATP-dependent RNA helicase DeaD
VTSADAVASFADLGLRKKLLSALTELGYEEPTPIQAQAIPLLVDGRDLLGQAATGTGKTAAFALPILQALKPAQRGMRPTALVLVPTRELCMQVSQAFHRYGRAMDVRVLPVYGGQPIGRQLRELERGIDVVVATPGRTVDHLKRRSLVLDDIATVVLDEADEMLDMGFADDLESILDATPPVRQTVLFSATMPSRINAIARQYLTDPVRIEIGGGDGGGVPTRAIRQRAYVVDRAHKAAALGRILDVESPTAAIVFCRTRAEVDALTETLNGRGYRSEPLHGGMDQQARDKVMGRLRSGAAELLVATDVAARGLDVEQLTHVFNYDVPSAPDSYVHRIGRVGRGGREGVAITLAEPREHRMLKTIERVTKQRIPVEKLPTIADVHAQRLELTRAALSEVLIAGDYEQFRVVVETLSDDHDVVEVAMAAAKLAHDATVGGTDDDEIPEVRTAPETSATRRKAVGRDSRSTGTAAEPHKDRAARSKSGAGSKGKAGRGARAAGAGGGGLTRLYVSAGRKAGVRPQDLVGAIANETRLSGRQIGAIEITDSFSLVEVPEDAAAEVMAALRGTRVKGNKVSVRRDRSQ